MSAPVTFLVDVDNTLLDNDRIRADFEAHLLSAYGEAAHEAYWTIQERRFAELGFRDYLGAVEEWWANAHRDPTLLAFSEFILDYPYAERLYPHALEVVARLRHAGPVVALTDGDAVFQARKVSRSGVAAAVDAVLIYLHKENELDGVERRHPARHYVLVDDKLRILAAAKDHWGERVTTVLPLQGQFANDAAVVASYPAADVTIAAIAELLDVETEALVRG